MARRDLYGLLAEFETVEDLLVAANRAREAGYRRMDAFTPLPVEGLAEAVGFEHTRLPLLVFIGGVIGCVSGFYLQYYGSVYSFSLNVGGKPLNSWPAFIPITFELTVLFAAIFCVFGLLALNGLPTPFHPVFNVPSFALASRDRFFLCIKARDPKFDREKTREFLKGLKAREVTDIEP
jgi:hypothetical protein